MEALKWFKKYPDVEFAPNAFYGRKDVIKQCKKLQQLGAKVEIPWGEGEDIGDEVYYQDTMIVTMPKTLTARFDVAVLILDSDFPKPDETFSNVKYPRKFVDWKKDKEIVLWWD